jgi:tRNA pseudouridine38-40 synthase
MSKFERKQQRKNDRYKSSTIRTIQGEVEKILSKRFQRLVKVVGAGRTDGGVHARGQAIHFDLYHNETRTKTGAHAANDNDDYDDDDDDDDESSMLLFERNLEITVNRMLPSDIRAWNLGRASPDLLLADSATDIQTSNVEDNTNTKQMPPPPPPGYYNWNAMRSCTSKLYSYRICISDAMNPSERHRRWQLPWQGVDAANVERLLRNFEGEHDFCCFAGALEQQERKTGFAMSTVRTIHKIKMVPEVNNSNFNNNNNNNKDDMGGVSSQNYYRIDIYLDGALYKMVRNIVGAVIDVARDGGWLEEETLLDLLHRPSESNYTRKDNPSKPAPSYGLTLERVFYPDETF